MRRPLKFLVHTAVVGLFLSLCVVWSGPAAARTVPKTLADPRPAQTGMVTTEFPVDYLGVVWKAPPGLEHVPEGAGPEPHGAVRFRKDGTWSTWERLTDDGIQARGQWASGLVSADGATAYEVRGLPDEAQNPTVVAINTTDGPPVTVAQTRPGAAHALSGSCRSRADWGADESLRQDAAGQEDWRPEFQEAQVMTVHHTATTNDDADPAATVRAIYRYHAVDQGWGDIGYHYLIDESGVVYEGRWSGTASASCAAGGDGQDFAHETGTDRVVTAAHTLDSNSGNVGVALLGEFTGHRRLGADPKPAAVAGLEAVLADLAVRHGMDPLGTVDYVNPVSGDRRTIDTISGHRDHLSTECPGDRLYALLGAIRENAAARTATAPAPDATEPAPEVTEPAPDATADSVHVGDLDGSTGTLRNRWWATVTATAADGAGAPAAGVVVDGTWTTTGAGATCTTAPDGTCSIRSADLSKGTGAAAFRVDALRLGTAAYAAAENTDPDGDSDGTTITVPSNG